MENRAFADVVKEKMRYKIVVSAPERKTMEKVWKILKTSKLYNSQEIVSVSNIIEVCDECAKRI